MSSQHPNLNVERGNGDLGTETGESRRAQAARRADEATRRAGQRIETMGRSARQRVTHAADTFADKTDTLGAYLQDHDMAAMADDVADVIRRYPVQSMLVGLGVGFMIGRVTSR